MASAQPAAMRSGPASEFVGRCNSFVETADWLLHTAATLDVVAPPSVPMNTSRGGIERFSSGRCHALDRDVQRSGAEQREERHAPGTRTVDGAEADLLARGRVERDVLPDERVVHAETMRTGRDGAAGGLTEEQCGEGLAVERDDKLPDAHVGGIAAFDNQHRVVVTGFLAHTR